MARIRSRRKRKRIAISNKKIKLIRNFYNYLPYKISIYEVIYNGRFKNEYSIVENNK